MSAKAKVLLGIVAGFGFAVAIPAHAQEATPDGTDLFTTVSDFNQWSLGSNTGGGSTLYDWDLATTNGLGNTTAAGATDTAGALSITLATPTNNYQYPAYSPGEQGNQGFLSAFDPGAVAGSSLAAYSGTLTMAYTTPTNNGGNYYGLGVVVNASGQFGQFFGTSVNEGIVNGQPTTLATIHYTVSAVAPGNLGYFQLGIIYNSNYAATTPIYVDDIELPAVPEPASIGMLGAGLTLLTMRRRRNASV